MQLAALSFLIAWYILNNEYLKFSIDFLYDKYRNPIASFFLEHLACFKCFSFWMTLFVTFDIFSALAVSFIAHLYDTYIARD